MALEIRASIAATPDLRWTFLQDPVIVEDALGRKFPIPSEYDFALLNAIIEHKFQDGPGAAQVAEGDYEVMDARNRVQILSVGSPLSPGSSLTMAILIGKLLDPNAVYTDESCPMPRCQSNTTTDFPGGGRQW